MEESPGEQVLKLEDRWDLLTGAVRPERADAQSWTSWGNPQTECVCVCGGAPQSCDQRKE